MPQQNSELAAIKNILKQNIRKNFVQRVVYPNQHPKLSNYDESGNLESHSTHVMSAEIDDRTGEWLVFPTVVQKPDGGLHRFDDNREAMKYAQETGEFIPFGKSGSKAIWFSKNYKKVWEQN